MKYLKDSFQKYALSHKGSIVGSFFDPATLNFDENIEINYSKLSADFTASPHYHAKTKTWVLVLKGEMKFRVFKEEIIVKAGEFLIFEKEVPEEVLSVEESTEVITIHAPSIKGGDKVQP